MEDLILFNPLINSSVNYAKFKQVARITLQKKNKNIEL